MESHMVHSFKRSETEEIRTSLRTYKEKIYIDIRVFCKGEKGSDWIPTKKGVTVSSEFASDLHEGITRAKNELSAKT
ncbi:MAG: hypothetical protein A3G33_08380 [Omnitrophica bacterium RIFCSPLOWO2_12_FULL_44_17]|uniref:Transcriptional coactivator p15 (PC4) C-terminal domain-containing protein n=1 Tax=Candidatus Danuiimicrobium aquiferis TaxID=1801832 RepID=A0A1G1KWB6_9BACT|nr:MAG: hypothetical protein A3B72_03600 [Omnitrophica bacterium RIFCSPHIGHO2_02_FULL_45_28]OGW90541.1 MAG: hypothetical protein A3E74_03120 [Omnitrophica bacterium RIFCSPHIGHO2_12_FULL_44_12]OGW97181.1 MAG: hypothetical protein A3G33_08380 [Omnitrophica bacterium RIFCSPLOWO2_12_FULL_44_17]OGX02239.1 MAG: hypothetical protein A3J12_08165 [Omnitrophica bacterium RIFCSPLOWO2_02_FULL_44_11]